MEEPLIDETSAISPSASNPNKFNRDARFGNSTLSSFALPILLYGSSCSRNMLNRAERFVMRRLVRKLSTEGRAVARLIGFGGSGTGFLLRRNVLPLVEVGIGGASSVEGLRAPSPRSVDFVLDLKRFIFAVCSTLRCVVAVEET